MPHIIECHLKRSGSASLRCSVRYVKQNAIPYPQPCLACDEASMRVYVSHLVKRPFDRYCFSKHNHFTKDVYENCACIALFCWHCNYILNCNMVSGISLFVPQQTTENGKRDGSQSQTIEPRSMHPVQCAMCV